MIMSSSRQKMFREVQNVLHVDQNFASVIISHNLLGTISNCLGQLSVPAREVQLSILLDNCSEAFG